MNVRTVIRCHSDHPMASVSKYPTSSWEPFQDGVHRCTFCGSVDPMELVELFEKGVPLILEPADRKYGYLHKIYVGGIPCPKAGELHKISSVSGPHVTADTPGAVFVSTCSHEDCREHGYWEKATMAARGTVIPQAKLYLDHAKDLDPMQLDRFSKVLEHYLRFAMWLSPEDGALIMGGMSLKGSALPKGLKL